MPQQQEGSNPPELQLPCMPANSSVSLPATAEASTGEGQLLLACPEERTAVSYWALEVQRLDPLPMTLTLRHHQPEASRWKSLKPDRKKDLEVYSDWHHYKLLEWHHHCRTSVEKNPFPVYLQNNIRCQDPCKKALETCRNHENSSNERGLEPPIRSRRSPRK